MLIIYPSLLDRIDIPLRINMEQTPLFLFLLPQKNKKQRKKKKKKETMYI
jgi:hypothetical protein